jgi:dihydrofolate reductase
MRKLIVIEFISLDGVVQAPGDPNEDPEGFAHGGWTRPFVADHGRYMSSAYRAAGALLFGRKTYQIFAGYWPTVTAEDDDIAHALNTLPKYVVSTTLTEAVWQPTIVLHGPVADEVDDLKQQPGKQIVVVGSSELVRTLFDHDLVDEYELWVHPIVLGGGKRLFPERSVPADLRLVDSRVTASGVVILTYRPALPRAFAPCAN